MNYKTIILVSASLIFAGCASNNSTKIETKEVVSADNLDENEISSTEKPMSLSFLQDVKFNLKDIDGVKPPVKNNQVSISFSYTHHFKDIIRGNAGCNNFFTTYSTQRSVLITGQMISTDNHCAADQMQIEGFMFNVYSQKPILVFKDNFLIMKTTTNTLTFMKEIEETNNIKEKE